MCLREATAGMDIRRWLENTADREPPDRSDDIDIPEKFRSDRPEGGQVGRSYRYKRKRASTDSSIIAPRRGHPPGTKSPAYSPDSDRVRRPQDGAGDAQDRECSGMPHAGLPDAPNKTYEKRARRKTRTDRYEPKTKKQKRERTTHKDETSNRRRRKPRRDDDAGHTTGLVQTFQMKNRPKKNRLTLKPDTSAGLFKHGRASMQLTGKGAGLPDLVFNEMRFLQRPTEHQDESGRHDDPHTLREKDPRLRQGEEISAYFNAKTAIGDEQYGKRDNQGQRPKSKPIPHQSEQSRRADQAKSLVELPEKPFLGFGSRGAAQSSDAGPLDDTSYYTWSESLQQPPTPHLKQAHEARIRCLSRVEARPQTHRHRRLPNNYQGASSKPTYKGTTETEERNIDHGPLIRTGQGGAAQVEVYQPPDTADQDDKDHTPALRTTSQSLPRYPSSPPPSSKHRNSGGMLESEHRRIYHTSDILKIRAVPVRLDGAHARLHTLYDDHDKENQDPASSLSIDKAIREANVAAAVQPSFPTSTGRTPKADIENLPDIRRIPSIKDLPRTRQLDRVGQTPSYKMPTAYRKPILPMHIQWPPLNSPFKQSNAERQHWEMAATETLASRAQQETYHQRPIDLQEVDALVDEFADIHSARKVNNDTLHDWDRSSSVVDAYFAARASTCEAAIHHASNRAATSAFSNLDTTKSEATRGLSVENDVYSEMLDVQQTGPAVDNLAGFWKPNVLY